MASDTVAPACSRPSTAARRAAQGFRAREKRRLARATPSNGHDNIGHEIAKNRDAPSTHQYFVEHVGKVDDREPQVTMAELSSVPHEEAARGIDGHVGIRLHSHTRNDRAVNQIDLCVKPVGTDGTVVHSVSNIETGCPRLGEHGGEDPGGNSAPSVPVRCQAADEQAQPEVRHIGVADVEECVEMGRHESSHKGIVLSVHPCGNHHLVCKNQNEPGVSTEKALSDPHSRSVSDDNSSQGDRKPSPGREVNGHVKGTVRDANPALLPAVDRAFVQKRSPRRAHPIGVGRNDRGGHNSGDLETSRQAHRVPSDHHRIRLGEDESRIREGFQDWLGDEILVKENKTSLTLLKKSSRVATEEENSKYPCHFPQVKTINLESVLMRMNKLTKDRFLKVWRFTTSFDPERFAIEKPMKCPVADAIQAVKNGLAVELPPNTPVTCHHFSVVEAKGDGFRRRPIDWARAFNDHCDASGYESKTNLEYFGNYFSRVLAQAGATFDLKAGFFQLQLPSASSFTFMDANGAVYGLSRLPMGICTAPELMQIVTCVLAGEPTHVLPMFRSLAVVDVWIDNVLFSGSKDRVAASVASFKESTEACSATINWKDSQEGSHELDFIGIHFNFNSHKISLAEKNRNKITEMEFREAMQVSELETACARLMYASAIVGVGLARQYFPLKFMRRILSKLNRGLLSRCDSVNLPASVMSQYKSWLQEVRLSKPRTPLTTTGRKSFTMWVDASRSGWGAVLIDDSTQQVRIVAGKWTEEEQKLHINVLEAKAIAYGLDRFEGIDNAAIAPRIDNTSVVATVGKGHSKSEDLNRQLIHIAELTKKRNIFLQKPTYVRSKDNLADEWSRYFNWREGMAELASGVDGRGKLPDHLVYKTHWQLPRGAVLPL